MLEPDFQADGTEIAVAINAACQPTETEEILNLGALDGEFYCAQWFPKAARQKTPPFHKEIWTALEGGLRYVSVEVFRGGAKTTMLRMFTSKRIAYGESRTIMYVSESQDHAKRSVRWMRRRRRDTRFDEVDRPKIHNAATPHREKAVP